MYKYMVTESYIKVENIGKQFTKLMNGINEVVEYSYYECLR